MEGESQAGTGQRNRVGGQLAVSHGAIDRSSGLSLELRIRFCLNLQKFTRGRYTTDHRLCVRGSIFDHIHRQQQRASWNLHLACRLESNFRERGADCSNPRWQHLHTNALLPADEHRGQTSRSLLCRGVLPIHCCASHVLVRIDFLPGREAEQPPSRRRSGDRPLSIFPDERFQRSRLLVYTDQAITIFRSSTHCSSVTHRAIGKQRTHTHVFTALKASCCCCCPFNEPEHIRLALVPHSAQRRRRKSTAVEQELHDSRA